MEILLIVNSNIGSRSKKKLNIEKYASSSKIGKDKKNNKIKENLKTIELDEDEDEEYSSNSSASIQKPLKF